MLFTIAKLLLAYLVVVFILRLAGFAVAGYRETPNPAARRARRGRAPGNGPGGGGPPEKIEDASWEEIPSQDPPGGSSGSQG